MTVASNVLIVLGAALVLLAGVGVLRLPDLFSRMHAGTKAASLGLAAVLAGVALVHPEPVRTTKLFLAVIFQFATAPVAAHVIGRIAYRTGMSTAQKLHDDLADHLEQERAATRLESPSD